MRWFTADLHLGHRNIIGYSGRPFPDAESMNAGLIAGWNAVVAPSDEVWVVGDVALGAIGRSLVLIKRLAGRKILVAGNHDRCWAGDEARLREWTRVYRAAGFSEVIRGTVRLHCAGEELLVGHLPYHGDSCAEDRFPERRPRDQGRWLLHGHVHQRWQVAGRQINVGVDAWGGRPVSEAQLADLVARGPHFAPPQAWPHTQRRAPRPEPGSWLQSGDAAGMVPAALEFAEPTMAASLLVIGTDQGVVAVS